MASTTGFESILPRVVSKHKRQMSSAATDSIRLDMLCSTSSRASAKRTSFLPNSLGTDDSPEEQRNVENYSRYSYSYERSKMIRLPTKNAENEKLKVNTFCTGSRYIGEFNQLGFCGKGVYKYPHGVIYDGSFNRKGEFHGTGTLIYPNGQKVEGVWKNGRMLKGATFVTSENVPFHNIYCRMPDRRFQIEINEELMPAGEEYLTNAPTARQIPKGMYDTGDGFYDPKLQVTYEYDDPTKKKNTPDLTDDEKKIFYETLMQRTSSLLSMLQPLKNSAIFGRLNVDSMPSDIKQLWIVDNCRKEWDEPTGFRPDLYENWTTGYKQSVRLGSIGFDVQCPIEEDYLFNLFNNLNKPVTIGPGSMIYSMSGKGSLKSSRTAKSILNKPSSVKLKKKLSESERRATILKLSTMSAISQATRRSNKMKRNEFTTFIFPPVMFRKQNTSGAGCLDNSSSNDSD